MILGRGFRDFLKFEDLRRSKSAVDDGLHGPSPEQTQPANSERGTVELSRDSLKGRWFKLRQQLTPHPAPSPPKGARGKGLRPLNGGNAVGVVRSGGATDLPRSFRDSPGMTFRYLVTLFNLYGTRYRISMAQQSYSHAYPASNEDLSPINHRGG